MSQLTKNTTDLDALIAKANALPDAGSGGGAAVETCTVSILSNIAAAVCVTTYENGECSTVYRDNTSGSVGLKEDIPNVVCGSALVVVIPAVWILNISGAEYIGTPISMSYVRMYRITAAVGETVTVDGYINV